MSDIKINSDSGTLDLISGPMFSGKTTEVLRRLFNEAEVGLKVLYINHSSDNRSNGPFSTHNPLYKEKLSVESNVTFASTDYLAFFTPVIYKYDVIGIDEGQFFEDLYDTVCLWVETHSKHLIVAGLSGDFRRKKFGAILELEPFSDTYTKLTSYCKICAQNKKRNIAPFTHKISGNISTTKEIGGSDKYIPVCRKCYELMN
jgi:thymidine kinase